MPDARSLEAAARRWLAEDPDPDTKRELEAILEAGDTAELTERFGARLEFGTAGLRGLLGAGPNRMNRALVRRVTAGLAGYLLETDPACREWGVVVGYDGRHMSPEFAEDTAAVLAGAGIPAHVFTELAPTPLIAFAVTALGAAAGVMVTASHNPPAYNGYKVYWQNGAQIIPPHDKGISAAIDAVGPLPSIPLMDADPAAALGLFRPVSETVSDAYLQGLLDLRRRPDHAGTMSIVYTPLHGVGAAWVQRVFHAAGYGGLVVVPEQAAPDGDFPTVEFPNPEEPGAMDLSLALAREKDADLILANDPDADRLAVIVRDGEGGYRPLSGNEIGILLAHYLLSHRESVAPSLVCTTIVSTGLLQRVADRFGAGYAETLTGFKWIANAAIDRKRADGSEFVFGFEEALGYTVGELVRDKDGVGAALVFAELAEWCRSENRGVLDYLRGIFAEFGYYGSLQKGLTYPGAEGLARIADMMQSLRSDPPTAVGGSPVVEIADIADGTVLDVPTGGRSAVDLPSSNVLRYRLEDGTRILVRPSGTEPKIKFYLEVVDRLSADEALPDVEARAAARLEAHLDSLLERIE